MALRCILGAVSSHAIGPHRHEMLQIPIRIVPMLGIISFSHVYFHRLFSFLVQTAPKHVEHIMKEQKCAFVKKSGILTAKCQLIKYTVYLSEKANVYLVV